MRIARTIAIALVLVGASIAFYGIFRIPWRIEITGWTCCQSDGRWMSTTETVTNPDLFSYLVGGALVWSIGFSYLITQKYPYICGRMPE